MPAPTPNAAPTPAPVPTLESAAAQTVVHAVAIAKAAHAIASVQPVDPALVKEAAELLVADRWTPTQDVEKVAKLLADPTVTMRALVNLVKTAGEQLRQLQSGDARLSVGRVVPGAAGPAGGTTKQSSDTTMPESEADVAYANKILSYGRVQN